MEITLPVAYIVYCDSKMLLDRGPYRSWRDIQDAYPDYKASLGPWSEKEIIGFMEIDWGRTDYRWPFSRQAITEFSLSGAQLLNETESEATPDHDDTNP